MIVVLSVSVVYTILLTAGLFMPNFNLPLYVAIFYIGNMMAFGVWYCVIIINCDDEAGASNFFTKQLNIIKVGCLVLIVLFIGMMIAGFAGLGFCGQNK